MKRVVGIGGIFFKSENPEQLQAWYAKHLGIPMQPSFTGAVFDSKDSPGQTIWSLAPKDSEQFAPSSAPFMINYRVENLTELVKVLREEGVHVDEYPEESEYGKFAWVTDPEGNRVELWEPPAEE